MPLISAEEIYGKTIFAKSRIPVYGVATEDVDAIRWVERGQPIGVVYGYVSPSTYYRKNHYWHLEGRPQFVSFLDNDKISLEKLAEQGAQTSQQIIQAQQQANQPVWQQITQAGAAAADTVTTASGHLATAALDFGRRISGQQVHGSGLNRSP